MIRLEVPRRALFERRFIEPTCCYTDVWIVGGQLGTNAEVEGPRRRKESKLPLLPGVSHSMATGTMVATSESEDSLTVPFPLSPKCILSESVSDLDDGFTLVDTSSSGHPLGAPGNGVRARSQREKHPTTDTSSASATPGATDPASVFRTMRVPLLFMATVITGILTNIFFGRINSIDPGCGPLLTVSQYIFAIAVTPWHVTNLKIPIRHHLASVVALFFAAFLGNKSLDCELPRPRPSLPA